jgi:ribosomal protein S8
MIEKIKELITNIENKYRDTHDKTLIHKLSGIADVCNILHKSGVIHILQLNTLLKKINKLMQFILKSH